MEIIAVLIAIVAGVALVGLLAMLDGLCLRMASAFSIHQPSFRAAFGYQFVAILVSLIVTMAILFAVNLDKHRLELPHAALLWVILFILVSLIIYLEMTGSLRPAFAILAAKLAVTIGVNALFLTLWFTVEYVDF